MKRKAVRKYFSPFPRWALLLALLFAAFSFAIWKLVPVEYVLADGNITRSGNADDGLVLRTALLGVCVPLAALGVLRLAFRQLGMPGHRRVDAMLQDDLNSLRRESMSRVGISSDEIAGAGFEFFLWQPRTRELRGIPLYKRWSRRPVLCGPWNRAVNFADFHYLHERQSVWYYLKIFPTEQYLALYSCFFDFRQGHRLNERTQEIYYNDVVRVGTETVDTTAEYKKGARVKLTSGHRFEIRLSSGDTEPAPDGCLIPNVMWLREGKKLVSLGADPQREAEQTVSSLRGWIRKLKGGGGQPTGTAIDEFRA